MQCDFFRVTTAYIKKDVEAVVPEFLVKTKIDDLMIRGGKFYAILNKETGMWEMNEGMVQKFVDEEINALYHKLNENPERKSVYIRKDMESFGSRSWKTYKDYAASLPDNWHQLDNKICFSDTTVSPKDYISKRLPYALKEGSYESWDELIGTLYSPEEREKIEWAIGSIISGDSKTIQKFIVLYGDPGAGKGTVIEIIKKLFPGYYEVFDAKSLSTNGNAFAFEQFRTNPLIALQSDGDLSRIEDNTKINSLVSHETIVMNEKRKQSYNFTPRCFLFMASNKPVKITDAKSGIIRRLIDVHPTGNTLPKGKYDQLMGRVEFELGGIAWHCLDVFRKLGKNYYNGYRPLSMMFQTDAFFNFMKDRYEFFCDEHPDGVGLAEAYTEWQNYCLESGLDIRLPRYKFREELKNYFESFEDRTSVNNQDKRSWFSGFKKERFLGNRQGRKDIPVRGKTIGLVLDKTTSLLDEMLKDCQAQYGVPKPDGGSKPKVGWAYCKTTLKDIDTSKLHFVRTPLNHIVIDFDIKNEKGEKDALLNLEAADKWPRTYAEYSQGGKGIHLHYIYDGDPTKLEGMYADDIEIKVYSGLQSLRRRLSLCNDIPVATLNDGALPKKEVRTDDMIDFESVKNEKHMRNIVSKCLRKDIKQPHTITAMQLIQKTLDDAWSTGIHYDIRDMRPAIRAFAMKSSNSREACMKIESELHYCDSETEKTTPSDKVDSRGKKDIRTIGEMEDDLARRIAASGVQRQQPVLSQKVETRPIPVDETLVFFDIEVFPNLLLVNWKEAGEGKGVVRMINPTRAEIGELLKKKLVGFNCRRYDNHILYARYLGYDNEAIYRLSQRIVSGSANAMFGNAYDISYTDVYDFAAKKQSLKKWEIELGIHHQELGLPWDKPVPEERWAEVAAYCDNDVIATEAVFNKLAGDFKAREILAEIAGMTVNDTTNQLTTRIIFGDDPKPQSQFNYPDLAKKFPGYRFENGKSFFRHKIYPDNDIVVLNNNDPAKRIYVVDGVEYPNSQVISVHNDGIEVDEIIGEGGRVFARQGIFRHVITFDVASMHPSSIIAENGFGKYTDGFRQLLEIRIAIKHKDFEAAKKMLNGRLARYLDDPGQAKALSQALKIAINSVYGLTAAGFDNKFRDPRNKDNWVAKRGALFIETLREKVTEMGGKVVHIKTDSIKVEEPTKEISDFIIAYGKQWGYTFEIEDIYEKMCLVNDAVYIALRDVEDPGWKDECDKARKDALEKNIPYVEPTRWAATGAQFAHPYVFKTLFSKREIEFKDLCETKTVTSALYLDMNENLSDVTSYERDLEKLIKRAKTLLKEEGYSGSWEEWPEWRKQNPDAEDQHGGKIYAELDDLAKDENVLRELIAQGHNYVFVGKAGSFCPVKAGCGGGILVREKDGKFSAATGSKGYRWREGESLVNADRMDMIDMGYFEALADAAKSAISEYGNFERFCMLNEPVIKPGIQITPEDISRAIETAPDPGTPPWLPPCGDGRYENCYDCPCFDLEKIPPECKKHYDLTDYFTVVGQTFSVDENNKVLA